MKKPQTLKPYKKGFLSVGGGHKLYYECCGNKRGKPILFLHGGPGVGFQDKHKRFFDPKVWNVILFDQRGSGRSKPFASIKNNSTQDLIKDITKLLEFLEIEKTVLFGTSWGATLALVYAISHPEKVLGLIIGSVYLGTKDDSTYLWGGGIKDAMPDIWERFVSGVPMNEIGNIIQYYYEQMTTGSKKRQEKYAYAWAYFECALLHLRINEKEIIEDLEKYPPLAVSRIEAFYAKNDCFLEDNYILDNASKLSDILVSITHGRQDMVCRPINSYLLHKAIKGSKLHFVTGGHSSSEPEIEKKLIQEVKRISKII